MEKVPTTSKNSQMPSFNRLYSVKSSGGAPVMTETGRV